MLRMKMALAGLALVALPACDPAMLTPEARTVAGVAGGAAAGLLAAEALEADDNWRVIAALGGAAAGTLVAQNTQTRQCAYSRGDGTYYTAACPAR